MSARHGTRERYTPFGGCCFRRVTVERAATYAAAPLGIVNTSGLHHTDIVLLRIFIELVSIWQATPARETAEHWVKEKETLRARLIREMRLACWGRQKPDDNEIVTRKQWIHR